MSDGTGDGPPKVNATAAALLGLLLEEPRTGWDLMAAARERIGEFWTLTQSQVYRELAALAERELIEAGESGPRDRRPYRATAAGAAAFEGWVRQEPQADTIRMPLLLTIAFAGHLPPDRLAEIIAARRAAHAERLERYRAARIALQSAREAPPARMATLEFGLRHEEAVLRWFDALPAILDAGT